MTKFSLKACLSVCVLFGLGSPQTAKPQVHLGDRTPTIAEFEKLLDTMGQQKAIGPAETKLSPSIDAPSPVSWFDINVAFAFGSAEIRPDSYLRLQNLASALQRKRSAVRLAVIGHTDAVGSAEYNQRLSERRARAVMSYLTTQGVEPDRLNASGKGFSSLRKDYPPTASEQRRVEIKAVE